MNICKSCKHLHREGRSENWSDFLCGAFPRERATDPVTGEEGYKAGDENYSYVSNDPYPHCRDINHDGNCKYYEERKHGLKALFG